MLPERYGRHVTQSWSGSVEGQRWHWASGAARAVNISAVSRSGRSTRSSLEKTRWGTLLVCITGKSGLVLLRWMLLWPRRPVSRDLSVLSSHTWQAHRWALVRIRWALRLRRTPLLHSRGWVRGEVPVLEILNACGIHLHLLLHEPASLLVLKKLEVAWIHRPLRLFVQKVGLLSLQWSIPVHAGWGADIHSGEATVVGFENLRRTTDVLRWLVVEILWESGRSTVSWSSDSSDRWIVQCGGGTILAALNRRRADGNGRSVRSVVVLKERWRWRRALRCRHIRMT